MKRKKQPQLTGPDYIVAIADELTSEGGDAAPYAIRFRDMAFTAAVSGPGTFEGEVIARAPLLDYEGVAASIVAAAARLAVKNRDWQALDEVLTFGVSLVAKWDRYLCAIDQHPLLGLKGADT